MVDPEPLRGTRELSPDIRPEETLGFLTAYGGPRTASEKRDGQEIPFLTQAKEAVELSRGFGLNLAQGASLFGNTQRLGIDQKKFAEDIGEAVARSRMHGREAEVMESVLHLSEQLVGRIGYLPNDGDNVMRMLGMMFQTGEPGLRGQFGVQRLAGVQSAVGGQLPLDIDVKTPFLMMGLSQMARGGNLPDDLKGMSLPVQMLHLRDRGPNVIPGMYEMLTEQIQNAGGVGTMLGYSIARGYNIPTDPKTFRSWAGMSRGVGGEQILPWMQGLLGDEGYQAYQDKISEDNMPGGRGWAAGFAVSQRAYEIRDNPKLGTDAEKRAALETAISDETKVLAEIATAAQSRARREQALAKGTDNLATAFEKLANFVDPAIGPLGDALKSAGPWWTGVGAAAVAGTGAALLPSAFRSARDFFSPGGAPKGAPRGNLMHGLMQPQTPASTVGSRAMQAGKWAGRLAGRFAGPLGLAYSMYGALEGDESMLTPDQMGAGRVDLPGFPPEYAAMVAEIAALYHVDEEEAASLIMAEGRGENADPGTGDYGLFQIHHGPRGPAPNSSKGQLMHPPINVHIGTSFYSKLQKNYPDQRVRLAAWNLGETRIPKDSTWEGIESGLPDATTGLIERFEAYLASAHARETELYATVDVIVRNEEGKEIGRTEALLTRKAGQSDMAAH